MFTVGMSKLDYNSMLKGQDKIRQRNQTSSVSFYKRFHAAIQQETTNPDPDVTSIKKFCEKYNFSTKTFTKVRHKEKRDIVANLPTMRKRGNPSGWKQNAWYN